MSERGFVGRRLLLLLAPFLPAVASCKDSEALASSEPGPGFAVIELFTSEGCSSCPPADEVLAAWVKKGDPQIFPLAFHVDYWDSLGWPDRFSSESATDRQRTYASSFGTSSVYTPQMIVGGTEEFVGSDGSHARAAVARAISHTPSARLTLTAEPDDGAKIRVHFRVESLPKQQNAADGAKREGPMVLRLALVERALVTRVERGENVGKTLAHENVVRAFETVPLPGPPPPKAGLPGIEGSATLTVPGGVDRARAEVIAYVQSAAPVGGHGMPTAAAARIAAPR
ncbi:MAG TPA: DUF1223 domain-containing protein [Polyangiaceae bacterium]|nr:DUF1223 domain-containing protein [Polyangiaceae bacterium]